VVCQIGECGVLRGVDIGAEGAWLGAVVIGRVGREVVPVFVEFEVAVPHLRPAWW
jgi:hypothetical protein